MITRRSRQVRLADGRCSAVEIGNKRLTMSLLILPGVVDALVLGWNFPTQVGAEIKYEGHEIVIPARNTHNGWLEEKVSVAVVQEGDFEKFLEAKLPYFQTMSGTS